MKTRLSAFLLLLLCAACAETPPPRPAAPLTLDYARLGSIRLAVAKLDFLNHSPLVPKADTAIFANFKPQLADAAYRWGLDRLQPVGAEGDAVYSISDATITRSKLPVADGVDSWFKRQQAEKWVGRLSVTLRISNGAGGFSGQATATASRSTTLPEKASSSEQENAYRDLLLGLMDDVNKQMEASIQQHLAPVLAVTQ